MSQKNNIASQQNFAAAVNSGNLGALDGLVTPDCVDHDPAPGQGLGPQGFRDFFTELRSAFPDLHIEPVHLLATEDEVAFAYSVTGTHSGPLMGHAATGKVVDVRGVQIGRFIGGKLSERWGSSDQLGILTQLGLA